MSKSFHLSPYAAFFSMNDRQPLRPGRGTAARIFAASSALIGGMVVGLGVGYLIDRHFATKPVWMAILGFGGLALGLYQVIKENMR